MADKTKVIEETKQIVSSILTSEKYGLPLQKLERTFEEFVGYGIPYSKMGFHSGRDFFPEISDAVAVSHTPDGGIHLDVITNDKIARVRKLVEKQKDPVRKSGGGRGGGRGGGGRVVRRNYQVPRQPPQQQNRYNQQRHQPYGQQRPQPLLPDYHRNQRVQRPQSQPAVPQRRDERHFQSQYNQQSSRVPRPQYDQQASRAPRTQPSHQYSAVVSRPPPPPKHPAPPPPPKQEKPEWIDWFENAEPTPQSQSPAQIETSYTPPGASVPAAYRGRILDLLLGYPNGLLASNLENVYRRRYEQRLSVVNMGFKTLRDMLESLSDIVELEHLPNGAVKIHKRRLNRVSAKDQRSEIRDFDDLKFKISKILRNHPNGLACSRLPTEFKNFTGMDLPLQKLGYQNVFKLIGDMPDIAKVVRTSAHDWTMYDVNSRKEEEDTAYEFARPSFNRQSEAPKMRRLQEDVRGIVEEVGDIPLRDFPRFYMKYVGEDLNVQEFGYSSLEQLMLALLQKEVISMDDRQGRIILFPAGKTMREFKDRMNIPEDAVGPGVNFPPLLPDVVISDDWIELFVCNVTNPGQLWLQLRGLQHTEALEKLMDKLEEVYYSAEGDEYKMPESMMKEGQVCAAIFPEDNNWHRVVITGMNDRYFVEGYFVDYGGSSCSLHKKNLRLLKRSLLKLPAQAIRGRLANIRPCGERWELRARDRLLSLVVNRPLIGLVTNIDKDGVVSVCLCDTSGRDDIHINDLLVGEGHATFEPDNRADEHSETNQQVTKDENVPTALEPDLRTAIVIASLECEEDEEIETVRYLKYVCVEEYCFHVINLDGKPYVAGPEISHILFGKDILRSKLRTRKVQPEKIVVSQQEWPVLFEALEDEQIVGCKDKEFMTLYELQSMVEILEVFKHSSTALIETVKNEIKVFDPEDPYWKGQDGEDDEDNDETASSGPHDELSIEDLERALKAFQYRRHKIIKAICEPGSEEEAKRQTDELFETERRLSDLKGRITKKKDQNKASGSTPDDVNEFIQSTIEKMYAKDRQRLSELKKPSLTEIKSKPVATVTGTSATNSQPDVAQSESSTCQVQNNLSDFISSLSITSAAPNPPQPAPQSAAAGNQTFTDLLNASLLTSTGFSPTTIPTGFNPTTAPTGFNPTTTANSNSQLLQQQQQLAQMQTQMQLMLQQQMMQQYMGSFNPRLPGTMPAFNAMPGFTGIDPSVMGQSMDGRSNISPPPGNLQKKE